MAYLIYAPETPVQKVYPLTSGVYTIGRAINNTIPILDISISRKHAEIRIEGSQIIINDLGSRNKTLVNGVEITSYSLKHGDLIQCGTVFLKFLEQQQQKEEEEEISVAEKVIKEFPESKKDDVMNELLSDDTTKSIIKLRHQESNQRALDKLQVLLEVSKQLSSPANYDQLLDKILELLFNIIHIDRAVILMVNELGELEPKAVQTRPGITSGSKFYSTKISNYVLKEGKTLITTNASIDKRFKGSYSIVAQGIQAAVCIPLKPREKAIGVLYIDNLYLQDVYTDEDVEFLTALTHIAAIAIDNAQLREKIQAEAIMRSKLENFFPAAVTKKLRECEHLEIVDTQVTALFADISNFTQISSTMPPRQVIYLLNEYFEVMVEEIVFHYEGTLEKYIGDALFAVWGAPYQQADDAERAIEAAIEMQWALRRLNRKWQQQGKPPIEIHIGINTGKVAAGNIGSDKLIQYATIGDTTNVTSRICNVAKAGEIVISQSTYEQIAEKNLPLAKMPLQKVKGKEEPLQLYRLLWELCSSEMGSH